MTFCISFRRCNNCTTGSGKEPDHLQGSDATYIRQAVVISNDEGWCMGKCKCIQLFKRMGQEEKYDNFNNQFKPSLFDKNLILRQET